MTPPPATRSGRWALLIISTARASEAGSAGGRGTCQVRRAEQFVRPVVRLGLHVLGQADGHSSRRGGIGEDPHGAEERVWELLRPLHPVEEAGHGTEGVVHRQVASVELLELLQHRVTGAASRRRPRVGAALGSG